MDVVELIAAGVRNIEKHDESAALRDAAERFVNAYQDFAGRGVVAASPQAERVVGAAMMLAPHLICRHGPAGVVVVDVNVASGTLIARAARRIRESGEQGDVVAIALNSLVADAGALRISGVSQVVVASPSATHASSDLEQGDRWDGGFAIAR